MRKLFETCPAERRLLQTSSLFAATHVNEGHDSAAPLLDYPMFRVIDSIKLSTAIACRALRGTIYEVQVGSAIHSHNSTKAIDVFTARYMSVSRSAELYAEGV